jgi:hypothetical protein
VHLRCEVDGDQPMDVSWKAKGSRIEPDYEIRYVSLSLLWHAHWCVLLSDGTFYFVVKFTLHYHRILYHTE